MVKLTGAGLILFAAAVLGIQMKQKLAQYVNQLIAWKEMLLMLSGEMNYAKAPLQEAFRHIAERGKEPFSRMLSEIADRMEQDRERTLQEIWRDAVEGHKKEFLFSQEERELLGSLGDNFGYLDLQMQQNLIRLQAEQLENRIEKARGELLTRQKLYQYLSVMGGLFLILLLI